MMERQILVASTGGSEGIAMLKGIRSAPSILPIRLSAFFTGIGFTSQNSALHSSMASSCSLQLSFASPSRYFRQISWVWAGATFANTEITPMPPKDMIGTIWSSFPE